MHFLHERLQNPLIAMTSMIRNAADCEHEVMGR